MGHFASAIRQILTSLEHSTLFIDKWTDQEKVSKTSAKDL